MAASHRTVEKIVDVIESYIKEPELSRFVSDLAQVAGNSSFRATIQMIRDEVELRAAIQRLYDHA
jgi:hypothetical protein